MNKQLLTTMSFIILMCLQLRACLTAGCQYNQNCDQKCRNKRCIFDQSTNSYYNSSITDTSGYHGPGCCQGCAYPYAYDHYYNRTSLSCVQQSCPQYDAWGNMLFWSGYPFFGSSIHYCSPSCDYYVYIGYALFKNYETRRCQYICSNDYFRDYGNLVCVKDCPSSMYGHMDILDCVWSCSAPYYTNNFTRRCQKNCSSIYYGVESTRQCLKECPYLQFRHQPTKMCLKQCPDGYYKSKSTSSCVSHCYNDKGLHQFYNHQLKRCNATCPYRYYGDSIYGFCLTYNERRCPPGLFKLQSAHKCVTNCSIWALNSTTPRATQHDQTSWLCVARQDLQNNTNIQNITWYVPTYVSTTVEQFVIFGGVLLVVVLLIVTGAMCIYDKCFRPRLKKYQIPADSAESDEISREVITPT